MATVETALKEPSKLVKHAATLLKLLATLICSGFVAWGAAQYRSGAQSARIDARVTTLEQHVQVIDQSIVPRTEHEAHWRAIEESQRETQADVREIRETQKQILLKLSK